MLQGMVDNKVTLLEIKGICIALDIDVDLFETNLFDWCESSPLRGNVALKMCKTRLLAGLPMPWEKGKDSNTDNWISAKERMPEIDQKVLVWARICAPIEEETGFPFILVYEGGGLTESFGLAGNIATVSHWMPLPEPPSE